jgi:hypothetical protein
VPEGLFRLCIFITARNFALQMKPCFVIIVILSLHFLFSHMKKSSVRGHRRFHADFVLGLGIVDVCLKVVLYHKYFCCYNSLKRKNSMQIRPIDFIIRILNSVKRNFTASVTLSTRINQTSFNYLYRAESFLRS